jgi:hypothetical protein
MGSKGRKPRKPQHSQHLPKVGTKAENDRLLHQEQNAVLNQMGMGGASPVMKTIVIVIIVILVFSAIGGLLILTTR